MKNRIKHKIFRWSLLTAVTSLSMLVTSCDGYLDVDEDDDNPTIAPNNQLFTQINIEAGEFTDFRLWSGDVLQVYTHQFVVREDADQYGNRPNDIPINNDWEKVYLTLTNINTLISQSQSTNNRIQQGYAQIMKVYFMTSAVDLWGDVPYSEIGKLADGILGPKFDDQVEIYQEMLDLIDTAKANISSGEGTSLGTADLFYGGDDDKWIRFANSFKLKLYNQIRLSDLFTINEANYNALVAEDNFFVDNEDDFEFTHSTAQAPSDERNNLYRDTYGGTQITKYASPWFYEILLGVNPNIHTGNADPRLPYYFVNQLEDGQFPRDQGIAPDPNADYWDAATGLFTIRFGSTGPDRDNAVENDATFPGIFPCGGRYDDNAGFNADINSGTGVAPKRIFTYDEFLYVQAELIQVGELAGDASAKLREAMEASFAKVDKVVDESETSQDVPALVGATETTAFIDGIIAEFTAASAEKQLEIIMTQKWVATFADPLDQYADYRRTGYPVLADPNSTEQEYQLDNGDAFPLNDIFTSLNSDYPLSLYWPLVELNLNPNANPQKVPTTYKIFWDN